MRGLAKAVELRNAMPRAILTRAMSCLTIVWGCYTHMHTQHCSAKRTNTARAFLTPQLMTQRTGENNLEKDHA